MSTAFATSSAELLPGEFRQIRRKRGSAKKKSDAHVSMKEKIEQLSGTIPFAFEPPQPAPAAVQNRRSAVGITGIQKINSSCANK